MQAVTIAIQAGTTKQILLEWKFERKLYALAKCEIFLSSK